MISAATTDLHSAFTPAMRDACERMIHAAMLAHASLPSGHGGGSAWPEYVYDRDDHGARPDLDEDRPDTGPRLRYEATPSDIDTMHIVWGWFGALEWGADPRARRRGRAATRAPGVRLYEIELMTMRAWNGLGYRFSWESIARHMHDNPKAPNYSWKWWSIHYRTLIDRLTQIAAARGEIVGYDGVG